MVIVKTKQRSNYTFLIIQRSKMLRSHIEYETLSITNLATTTALTTVENKRPDHSKYMTSPEFGKVTVENFTVRLKNKVFHYKLRNSNK